MPANSRRLALSPLIWPAILLLGVTAWWLYKNKSGLGVSGQWAVIPNVVAWPIGAYLLPMGALFIFGGAALLAAYDRFFRAKNPKEQRASTRMSLASLMILAFLWPWMLLGPGSLENSAHRPTFEGRFNILAALWSDSATEYFGLAYQISDARQFSRDYAAKWQKPPSYLQAHAATHPPGATLVFYGVRRLVESSPALENALNNLAATLTGQSVSDLVSGANIIRATAARSIQVSEPPPLPASALGAALLSAALMTVACAGMIPAVYGIAAAGGDENGEKRGLVAAGFFVLAPTLNLFAFTLDALVACGVVWSLFFVARFLSGKSFKNLAASGVFLALASALSIGALSATLILILAILWGRNADWKRAFLSLFAGFSAAWLVLLVLFPFSPIAVFLNAMSAHRIATLNLRSHAAWAIMNLVTWTVFCGWPVVLAWFFGPKAPREAGAILGAATLLTLVLLSLSGNVRGEVERLWLFSLAPLCALTAWKIAPRAAIPLLGLQAAQTLLMAATLAPLVRPF